MDSLGTIRSVQVEYVQGGKADEVTPMPTVMTWSTTRFAADHLQ